MATRQASLAGVSGEGESVDMMIKLHEDISRAIAVHEEKIEKLKQDAENLIAQGHYNAAGIAQKLDEVLERWAKLKQAMLEHKGKLGDVQTLQSFIKDADEIEIWMSEKLQIAMDESYKDPTNVQAKHQKHQAFESELAANAERVSNVVALGKKLIDRHQCLGQEDAVKSRIEKMTEQWEMLVKKSTEKSEKLQEANRQSIYNAGVKVSTLFKPFSFRKFIEMSLFGLEIIETAYCTCLFSRISSFGWAKQRQRCRRTTLAVICRPHKRSCKSIKCSKPT